MPRTVSQCSSDSRAWFSMNQADLHLGTISQHWVPNQRKQSRTSKYHDFMSRTGTRQAGPVYDQHLCGLFERQVCDQAYTVGRGRVLLKSLLQQCNNGAWPRIGMMDVESILGCVDQQDAGS